MKIDYPILLSFSQVFVILPFIVGLVCIRHLGPLQKLLWLLVCCSIITELLAFLIIKYQDTPNNLPVYNLYVIFSFAFINRIYAKGLNNKIFTPLFNWLLVFFGGFTLVNLIFLQPITTYNTNLIILSYTFYIAMCIIYFYRDLKESSLNQPKKPIFWLSTGMLIYYSGSLMLFVFINQIIASSKEVIEMCWTLNAILFVLLNIFYALALWTPARK